MRTNSLIINRYGHTILFCLLAALLACSTDLGFRVTDTFHEGEYVGFLWHMRDYYQGLASFPLLIHGAIDYIPSLIGALVSGDEHVIVGTRLINTVFVGINWILFLHICYSSIPRQARSIFWTASAIAVLYCFAPQTGSNAFTVSSQFLGVRDTFLLLSLYFFTKYSTSDRSQSIFLVLGSFSTATAVFWCYDRGVISIALFLAILAGTLVNKRYLSSVAMVVSALFFAALLNYSNIFGPAAGNIGNYIYWIKHSAEITGYPVDMAHAIGYYGAFVLSIFAVAAAAVAFSRGLGADAGNARLKFLIMGLIVVQFLEIKVILNRADLHRSFIGGWPSILLLFHFLPGLIAFSPPSFDFSSLKLHPAKYLPGAFKAALVSLVALAWLTSPIIPEYIGFATQLFHPTDDAQLVSRDLRNLSSLLHEVNDDCFYGWTNEGVIALMSGKRFCTHYPYAFYASRDNEPEMLRQLIKESPKAIVFDSASWSTAIDGKPMSERFPAVNQFILANYPNRQRVGSYAVLLK